jgi:hypothetical protein
MRTSVTPTPAAALQIIALGDKYVTGHSVLPTSENGQVKNQKDQSNFHIEGYKQ